MRMSELKTLIKMKCEDCQKKWLEKNPQPERDVDARDKELGLLVDFINKKMKGSVTVKDLKNSLMYNRILPSEVKYYKDVDDHSVKFQKFKFTLGKMENELLMKYMLNKSSTDVKDLLAQLDKLV